ncbi:hypothetical protein [Vibrio phage D4]|nr:hypothetical protein [Vibrio phage D4]WKV32794.1 hypothetical protein R21Y_33 [Vibrio phage vB_VhaS_R21Y]
MTTQVAKMFEVYGEAHNGARHQLGLYFGKDKAQAERKAKRDYPDYIEFNAMLYRKMTKGEFYENFYHHQYNWSEVAS